MRRLDDHGTRQFGRRLPSRQPNFTKEIVDDRAPLRNAATTKQTVTVRTKRTRLDEIGPTAGLSECVVKLAGQMRIEIPVVFGIHP